MIELNGTYYLVFLLIVVSTENSHVGITECISTTSLPFLINGAPFGFLNPTRGIRQGDPLSPSLFVIYMEMLSRLLTLEENSNHFKEIKICRYSPSISHLMFADDLLIFCRANTDDAICIKMILERISISSSEIANSIPSTLALITPP